MKKKIIGFLILAYTVTAYAQDVKVDSITPLKDKTTQYDTLTFIGVGDMMLGTNFPDPKYLPPNDGKDLLKEVAPILRNADVTFGNHEGVLLDSGGIQKKCSNPDLCYLFRSPQKYIQHFVDAGFDLLSMANNHMGDFGEEGRKNTQKVMDAAGIESAGLLTKPYTIITVKGLKIGLAAFSPNSGVMDFKNVKGAKLIVQHLDTLCDIVIVSFHGGAEGRKFQNVTRKPEIFYGENRGNVYEFAHAVIDSGADIVFGHGPHVTRAMEVYKDRYIAYSLGNFCTYARFNLKEENGLAPIVKLYTDPKGRFLKGEFTSVIQIGEGGPIIDPEKRALKKVIELNKIDFPESKLNFNLETGVFKLK
jgi:poly-gamma-glutamate capsule biosynthesis protein CapA/YwtB (metallophosphatase superfamily)